METKRDKEQRILRILDLHIAIAEQLVDKEDKLSIDMLAISEKSIRVILRELYDGE